MVADVPKAKKQVKYLTAHGDTRKDDYYWLNAYFKKTADSEAVISYLEEENRYLDKMMMPLENFRNDLFEELKSRIIPEDQSVPFLYNGYWYYTRFEKDGQYRIYCRKKGELTSNEELLF